VLTFVMIGTGLDPVTAFSAVAATINNEGPGLGSVNSTMAGISTLGKWVLIVTMVAGRLEIFTFLIVFTPAFWGRWPQKAGDVLSSRRHPWRRCSNQA
jgi:trk system potassium uptake protein